MSIFLFLIENQFIKDLQFSLIKIDLTSSFFSNIDELACVVRLKYKRMIMSKDK